jgi:hypothetical protein
MVGECPKNAAFSFSFGLVFVGLAAVKRAVLFLMVNLFVAMACGEQAGVRSWEVKPGAGGKVGFTSMGAEQTGVSFTNMLGGDAYLTNAVAHNGSGVALGDVDGDGRVDIYFCNLQGANRLYRNLGSWKFEEMKIGAAACEGQMSTGATFADVDGDGDLDLLVNGIAAGTRLFLNDGKGNLAEKLDAGLSRTNSGMSMALADIDGDGDLDLYCAHYTDAVYLSDPLLRFGLARKGDQWLVTKVNDQPATMARWTNRFVASADGRVRELPETHALYRNDGNGHFTAIQNTAFLGEDGKPMAPYRDWGLAVMFRDLNGDGAPDIYVCNDNASPDRIWINQGNGTFKAAPQMMFRHTSRSAMGLDFADVDRDGRDDIMIVDMLAREHGKRMTQLVKDYPNAALKERIEERPEYNRNTLFFGRADGTFYEAGLMAGVAASDWSWCPIFIDVDLDGYEDLLITNGFEFDVLDQDGSDARKGKRYGPRDLNRFFGTYPKFQTKNAAFRNRGDATFEAISEKWGFDAVGISNGMALADLDNDGDLDVVVNNLNGVASLYRNDSGAARIGVRLKGSLANATGVGSKIRVVGSMTQSQEMIAGGRYLSGDEAMRVFAAAEAVKISRIEITWRSGSESVVTNVQANRIYEIGIESAVKVERVAKGVPKPFFKEAAEETNFVSKPAGLISRAEFDTEGHLKTVFAERAGAINFATIRAGKMEMSGCWRAIAAGDFDGDGKIDFVAGNVGRNTEYELYQPTTFRIYSAEDGPVEAWQSGDKWAPVRDRLKLAARMLDLARVFTNHAAFARATIPEIVGDKARFVEAKHLESMVFMNRGNKFEARRLPREAQLSPVNAICVGDFDGDGIEDVFLAQNWFGGPSEITRDDNGRGLWLRGRGDGSFVAVDSTASGVNMFGEQRAAALGDFNGDGRVDLAVMQSNDRSKIYLNEQAKRGLRVSFAKAGAQVRVVYANGRKGPIRVAGEGTTQILGLAEPPEAIWVRWTGGKEQTIPIAENLWDIVARPE